MILRAKPESIFRAWSFYSRQFWMACLSIRCWPCLIFPILESSDLHHNQPRDWSDKVSNIRALSAACLQCSGPLGSCSGPCLQWSDPLGSCWGPARVFVSNARPHTPCFACTAPSFSPPGPQVAKRDSNRKSVEEVPCSKCPASSFQVLPLTTSGLVLLPVPACPPLCSNSLILVRPRRPTSARRDQKPIVTGSGTSARAPSLGPVKLGDGERLCSSGLRPPPLGGGTQTTSVFSRPIFFFTVDPLRTSKCAIAWNMCADVLPPQFCLLCLTLAHYDLLMPFRCSRTSAGCRTSEHG